MFRRRPSSDNDARILIANSLVDIDPDYAVSASDLPNRGTGGSGYDLDTNVGTAANRKIHPSGTGLLFGSSGDYFSTPDSAAKSVTDDITLEFIGAADDWTPTGSQVLIDGGGTAAPNFAYFMRLQTSGAILLDLSEDGTNRVNAESSAAVPFSDGALGGIRAKWDQSANEVTFETSTDGGATWSQLGTTRTLTLGGINDSNSALSVGANSSGTISNFAGYVARARVYNDATASNVVVDFDPTNYVSGTTFSSGGVTWTLSGNSFIQNTGHDVLHSIGSNGLETAAGQSINAPGTVFAVAKFSQASPSASQAIFAARSLNTARWTVLSDDSNADKFTLIEGSVIALSEAYDTDPHIFTAQFNGDATTKLTVSGVGGVTGDAGAHNWDFGTILARFDGNIAMQGYIARLLVFDYALSETQVSAIQNYLSAYYGGI